MGWLGGTAGSVAIYKRLPEASHASMVREFAPDDLVVKNESESIIKLTQTYTDGRIDQRDARTQAKYHALGDRILTINLKPGEEITIRVAR